MQDIDYTYEKPSKSGSTRLLKSAYNREHTPQDDAAIRLERRLQSGPFQLSSEQINAWKDEMKEMEGFTALNMTYLAIVLFLVDRNDKAGLPFEKYRKKTYQKLAEDALDYLQEFEEREELTARKVYDIKNQFIRYVFRLAQFRGQYDDL